MLDHYWQLVRHHKRIGVVAVVGAAILAALISIALLVAKPTYLARTTVLLLPSDAEIAYARGLVSSEYAALTLTETHVEYLQSRSVAAAVLERLRGTRSQLMGDGEEGASQERKRSPVSVVLGWVSRLFKYLNYGMYVPADPEQGAISMIASAVKIVSVKGSYILQFQVRLGTPELAAEVANALADVYIQQVTTDLELNAARLQDHLNGEIDAREQELETLVLQEMSLRKQLGLTTAVDERGDLSSAFELERKKVDEDTVQIEALEGRLQELRAQQKRAVRPDLLAKIEQDISIGESELRALTSGLSQRRSNIRRLETMIGELEGGEQLLASLLARKQLAEQDIQNLRQRLLATELTRTAAIAKVRVIDPATPPSYPESPKVLSNTLLGGIAGAVIFALFLVAVDTFSSRVATSAELGDATGARILGEIDGTLLAATEGSGDSRSLTRLAKYGGRFERRLAAAGALTDLAIDVTGFVSAEDLDRATTAIAAALASLDRPVRCQLAAGAAPSSATLDALAGNLTFGDGGDEAAGDALVIRATTTVARGFSFEEASRARSGLVCVVDAGRLTPEELREFQKRVVAAGLASVSYALLDA